MGLHCHQPVDNFESVFENAYNKSYEPFISVLERHPKIRLSFHFSGSLLDWIVEKRPDFINRVKKLIDRKQVEILTGGHFEPVLSMIPPEDAKGQIRMLTEALKKHFGCRPCGIWLAERIWDPALSGIFRDLNLRYTIVDDFHLTTSGVKDNKIFGHYSVKGVKDFSVFASVKKLRYAMPFRTPSVTMDFLKGLSEKEGEHFVTFADDCEKFGLWPHTYDWVYRKGWLDKFFTEIEKRDSIRTLTFSEALRESGSLGEVDIPHSSYAEMMQWCDGNFNNFFRKYPESNFMRKRMLELSRRISESADVKIDAKKELYKAQSNCAYWHGIFSGVYLNWLRQGIYRHIIKAESTLDETAPKEGIEVSDLKNNPGNVIRMQNKFLNLLIDPEYSGSILEMDYKPCLYNLANTMTRRYEPYHNKLSSKSKIDLEKVKKLANEDESIDLYEVLGVRERNLKRFLNYDSYKKASFLCHFMDLKTSLADFVRSRHVDTDTNQFLGPHSHKEETRSGRSLIELEKNGKVKISGRSYDLKLNKCIILEKDSEISVKFDLQNESPGDIRFLFGIEFNWALEDRKFMRNRNLKGIKHITLLDRCYGFKVEHILEKPMDFWSFPLYTLNESESGLGKNFQEISLLFSKKLSLKKSGRFSMEAKIKVSK